MREISAGGVVYKQEMGELYLLLIEDKYYKVTLPKGKQEAGETLEETAIREIKEETGIDGRIVQPISKIYYNYNDYNRGHINKEVTYFLVEAVGGKETPQLEEINQVFWLNLEAALERQSKKGYDNNREIFEYAYKTLQNINIHDF